MYFYNLSGYEENTIITNEKKYSKEDFKKMCKEAPLGGSGTFRYYDTENIIKYLKRKYKFQELKPSAGFFVDGNIEDEIKEEK